METPFKFLYLLIGLSIVLFALRMLLYYFSGKKKVIKVATSKISEFKDGLKCPVCRGHRFYGKRTMLNTFGLTMMNYEWLNKTAQNYICVNCGHILWYMK